MNNYIFITLSENYYFHHEPNGKIKALPLSFVLNHQSRNNNTPRRTTPATEIIIVTEVDNLLLPPIYTKRQECHDMQDFIYFLFF